jgi:hypothetical protein
MAGDDATSKLIEALNESTDALIDAIRAANDRGHRFSIAMLEQAQESQREAAELARKWIAAPLDIMGLVSAIVENTTKAQARALDATRQWFGELSDAQRETRELIQRITTANRQAGTAGIEVARAMITRRGNGERATNGDGARPQREIGRAEIGRPDMGRTEPSRPGTATP